jgi:hypothetical protein
LLRTALFLFRLPSRRHRQSAAVQRNCTPIQLAERAPHSHAGRSREPLHGVAQSSFGEAVGLQLANALGPPPSEGDQPPPKVCDWREIHQQSNRQWCANAGPARWLESRLHATLEELHEARRQLTTPLHARQIRGSQCALPQPSGDPDGALPRLRVYTGRVAMSSGTARVRAYESDDVTVVRAANSIFRTALAGVTPGRAIAILPGITALGGKGLMTVPIFIYVPVALHVHRRRRGKARAEISLLFEWPVAGEIDARTSFRYGLSVDPS